MLRIPTLLNSEVYVQIDSATFDILRVETKDQLTFKLYNSVRPYIRKNSSIVRYTTDRILPHCYLLVKEFSKSDTNINIPFALKYLNEMHGVTSTFGSDSTDCLLLNVDRGARFNINSSTFNDDYARWALHSLNITDSIDTDINNFVLTTTIGTVIILTTTEHIALPTNNDVHDSKDSTLSQPSSSDDAADIINMFKTEPKVDVYDDVNDTCSSHADALPSVDHPASPVIGHGFGVFNDKVVKPDYWECLSADTAVQLTRIDKEALLKFSISILSLPVDPEFINENNAVRTRMYSLFWELNQ